LIGAAGLAVVATTQRPSLRPSSAGSPPGDRRAAAVGAALAEFERVNAPGAPPANPADYWAVAAAQTLSAAELRALDWCGGFYLWALKVAGVAPASVFWRFDGTGIGSARLRLTKDPQPADLAYFTKNQHHAMVRAVEGDAVHLINGNGGGKGITLSTVSRGDVAGFYSVAPLLSGGLNA
jgi:hypothetical protein